MSNLTSAEWAAWVQAIGSVAAIFGAAWIAIHQAGIQHRNALELQRTKERSARVELGRTLSVLALNASKAMQHIADQLSDRESVHQAAEGLVHCDLGGLQQIDKYVREVPLHTVPYALVSLTMILGATLRQFKEKMEMALRLHRQMDAAMFQDFFQSLSQMNESVARTCKEIDGAVKGLETT